MSLQEKQGGLILAEQVSDVGRHAEQITAGAASTSVGIELKNSTYVRFVW